ncbi:thiamine-phosphate kinase [Terasakiella sp. A23]|uniref:thiamine-phosphate kinase n=1 Tax=Terasakiella sp. FCG-A23 TaxID=3080561 RepID=UPI002952CD41|nr:thiamine-phosphate kinase [Terasakiella sp. A23]MDV7338651.1 thiamine-phosphate kinase [Terasakiella sp. A23]
MLGEFEQISQIMAPLAEKAKGAFGLKDDAAVFSHGTNQEIVVTTDTLIADVHFFADDPAETIAHKLLGVNLSDLAAMGASPLHYTLNASYPKDITVDWIKAFAKGLQAMQERYGIVLIGGDTTRTPGPLSLSVSAFGTVSTGESVRRTTARAGDLICVSGTIGDGALGLLVAQDKLSDETSHLLNRYQCPQPRVDLGKELSGFATACLDVSDGLITDFRHMDVGGAITWSKIPLSAPAQKLVSKDSSLISTILNGGDDYELLFAIDPKDETRLAEISERTETAITVIGRIQDGSDISVIDGAGQKMDVAKVGYRHF